MSKKINKEDVQKKWKPFLDNMNISEDKKGWLLQYAEKHQIDNDLMERCIFGPMPTSSQQTNSGITNTLPPLLPIARRVHAQTLVSGGYGDEDPERIQRRNRIIKLKRILDKKSFRKMVSRSEETEIMKEEREWEDGLVSVQPMSLPTGNLMFMDFVYETETETTEEKAKRIRKERTEKIERIFNESK